MVNDKKRSSINQQLTQTCVSVKLKKDRPVEMFTKKKDLRSKCN